MATRREYRVTFYSPGTFFSEDTTKKIGEWDRKAAVGMAESIAERYGARPFGFRFSTVIVADPIPDGEGGTLSVTPKQIEISCMHFLGGRVETYAEVVARDDPDEKILRDNMRWNDVGAVVVHMNPLKSVQPFEEDAVQVDALGEIMDRASNYPPPEPTDD